MVVLYYVTYGITLHYVTLILIFLYCIYFIIIIIIIVIIFGVKSVNNAET